ncbi:hypothetical protein BC936DRAFT_147055 [Jimgerdemannia flammicorona]|uniref:Uncharacterized protein n=1 Tax=Jimgerdemannia flammicorona TaxID=994334 RepID=A0A433D698_9FUNG|nr:hypothetical protein BC936DRAFT_147055 [Jimgerdemannia flammicorona]
MGFYFKGDQLFAKRADIPTESQDEWTTFVMDLRESAEMPNLDNFTRFLATSLGFGIGNIGREYYDDMG